jgi:hypothetical protein
MATNKLVLRDVDQVMADFKPIYTPIFPLFQAGGVKHQLEVGKLNFKRMEAVSDIRSKHVTPKDTVLHQIVAKEGTKTFKIYPFASQFVQSMLQDSAQNEDIIRQVLDEQWKHMDDLLLLGEGTADNNVVNDGLFWNGQDYHVTESSVELDTDQDVEISLYQQVQASAVDADQIDGEKLIIFYGANVLPLYRGLFAASSRTFKSVLSESLPNYRHMELPEAVTPASSHGYLVVNLSQVKLHYSEVPQLFAQGVNEEKMHVWRNFLMGSCMVDVLANGAILKQPLTIEA